MKHLIRIFAFLCLGIPALPAQSWFENNPKWINYFTAGFSGDGYEYATITGDTVLNGLPAKVVNRYFDMTFTNDLTQIRVLRQQGDSIWSWYNGDYHLMYNFSLAVGDTLSAPVSYSNNVFSRYKIDSIGQINVGGETLRFQRVQVLFTNQLPYFTCHALIIEKMGMVGGSCYNSNNNYTSDSKAHFFFTEPNTDATDGPSWRFCRFQNDDIQYNASPSCALTDVADVTQPGFLFRVVPNPFNTRFSILSSPGVHLAGARLFDISGQLKLQTTALEDRQIDAADLAPGLYILEITSDKHEKTYLKLVKNR